MQRLLSTCNRRTALGARNYAMTLALLDTGLRVTEFAGLRVGDVDMRNGMVVVVGKGQKQRQVRIGSKARTAILKMLAFRNGAKETDPL